MGKQLTTAKQEQHNQPLPDNLNYILGVHTDFQRRESEKALHALGRLDARVRNAVIAAIRKQKPESAIEEAVRQYNDTLAAAYHRQARERDVLDDLLTHKRSPE